MCSLLVASCTSAPNGDLQIATYENDAAMVATPSRGASQADGAAPASAAQSARDAGATPLPAEKPGTADVAASEKASEAAAAEKKPEATAAAPATATERPGREDGAGATTAANETPAADATGEPLALASPQTEPAAKKSLFSSLFSTNRANATPQRAQDGGKQQATARKPEDEAATKQAAATEKPKVFIENIPAKPVVDLESKPARKPVVVASLGGGGGGNDGFEGLPGVRQSALFEIKRKSGIDDDSDIDLHEEEIYRAPVRVASAAGLARLAPNGLLKQTEDVDVACLKPSLVRILKAVEQRYGRKVVVTSGYRDRARNLRARGAKNSQHMYCAAADIQVPGVAKAELASFLRSVPGRGGVGTYCHTESVHIDVGPEREWNWRCRRRG
jgi:uncharacterized protein YcbK (DUF882 family)